MTTFESLLKPTKETPTPAATGLRAPLSEGPAATQTGTFAQMVGAPATTGLRAKKAEAPVDAPRTFGGTVKDVGIDLLKGAISIPEAVVGLADIPTAGYVGKGLEQLGFKPAEAKDILSEQYSEARKGAGLRFSEAEGFTDKTLAALANPSVIASAVLESLPLMGAGGVVARGLEGATFAGRALSGVARGAIGEGVVAAGSAAEGVRQQTDDDLLTGKQATLAALSGALTGAFTMVGGKVAAELGIADVDTFLAGANQTVRKQLARRTVEGFVSEGVLEELPQSIQEQVIQNISLGAPAFADVDEAAALGLLSGGVMGAGFSAAQGDSKGLRTIAKDKLATDVLSKVLPDHTVSVTGLKATITAQDGTSATVPAADLATRLHAGESIDEIIANAEAEQAGTTVADINLQGLRGRTRGAPSTAEEAAGVFTAAAEEAKAGGEVKLDDGSVVKLAPDVAVEPPAVEVSEEAKQADELEAARVGRKAAEVGAAFGGTAEQAAPEAVLAEALAEHPAPVNGTREIFTVGNRALEGNVYIEDVDVAGNKTVLAMRPNGFVRKAQAGEVKMLEKEARTPFEEPAPLQKTVAVEEQVARAVESDLTTRATDLKTAKAEVKALRKNKELSEKEVATLDKLDEQIANETRLATIQNKEYKTETSAVSALVKYQKDGKVAGDYHIAEVDGKHRIVKGEAPVEFDESGSAVIPALEQKRMRDAATEEAKAHPTRKVMEEAKEAGLSRDIFNKDYSTANLSGIPNWGKIIKADGTTDPGEFAQDNGFESVDAMLDAFRQVKSLDQAVADGIQEREAEWHRDVEAGVAAEAEAAEAAEAAEKKKKKADAMLETMQGNVGVTDKAEEGWEHDKTFKSGKVRQTREVDGYKETRTTKPDGTIGQEVREKTVVGKDGYGYKVVYQKKNGKWILSKNSVMLTPDGEFDAVQVGFKGFGETNEKGETVEDIYQSLADESRQEEIERKETAAKKKADAEAAEQIEEKPGTTEVPFSKAEKPATGKSTAVELEARLDKELGKRGRKNLDIVVEQSPEGYDKGGVAITDDDGTTQGFFNPNTGQIVLFADRVGADQAWPIALHEAVHQAKEAAKQEQIEEHRKKLYAGDITIAEFEAAEAEASGWSGVFGKRSKEIMALIDTKLKENDTAWKAAEKRAIKAGTKAEHLREETITYFLDNNANAGTSLWKRIMNAIRAWAVSMGIKRKLTDADIQAVAEATIQRRAREGATRAKGAGEILFSKAEVVEQAKSFFSKLQQVAADKFTGMKAQGVKNFLTKHGVKKIEMEATGLDAFLASKKGTDKVTKQELEDFVKANTVEFEDVMLGDSSSAVGALEMEWDGATLERRAEISREIQQIARNERTTHFSEYQEPGAVEGSYRELFVAAPSLAEPDTETQNYLEQKLMPLRAERAKLEAAGKIAEANKISREISQLEGYQREARAKGEWQDGHSAYSGVKNPIVRIRFNEVEVDGKRILRIEEMQGPNPTNQEKMPSHLRDNIYNIGTKRILTYAKENGFDGVALTTKPDMTAGETQADRYSLEKQVELVSSDNKTIGGEGKYVNIHTEDSLINLTVDRKGVVIGQKGDTRTRNMEGQRLSDVIGKDIAERIMTTDGPLKLRGEDLKIGGEGLKKLYDTQIPAMLEAYGKGKMVEVDMAGGDNYRADQRLNQTLNELLDGSMEQVDYDPNRDNTPPYTMSYLPITEKTPATQPLFSRGQDPEAAANRISDVNKESLAKLIDQLQDRKESFLTQHADKFLKVVPLFTLGEMVKKRMPLVKTFIEQMDSFIATRNDMVEKGGINYDTAVKAAKTMKGADGVALLQRTAELGSYYQMHPDKDIMEQDWLPEGATAEGRIKGAEAIWEANGMLETTGKTFKEAHREARDAYRKLDGPTQKAYLQLVKDMADLREREKNDHQRTIEEVTDEGSEAQMELLERLEAAFSGVRGAYMPLHRVGDWVLMYDDPATGQPVREHFKTLAEMKAEIRSLKILHPGLKPKTTKSDDLPTTPASTPAEFMKQLNQAVLGKYTEDIDPDDTDRLKRAKARADEIIGEMTQTWLRWLPETAAMKNALKRRSVKGYSTDMLHGYLEYMQRHGGNVAFLENGRKIEDTLEAIAKDNKALPDSTFEQVVLNDLRARFAAMRTAKVGKAASALSRLGTFYYMTSPSIFLVQMSQLGVLTFPHLATKFGALKAFPALTEATRRAFSPRYSRKAMLADQDVAKVYENLMARVTPQDRRDNPDRWGESTLGEDKFTQEEILKQIKKLSDYQKRLLALRVSMAKNVLDISLTHEVIEMIQGGDPNSKMSKGMKGAMLFMRHGELASRKAAILATFELKQQEQDKAGKGRDFYASMDEVVKVSKKTLFDYTKEGKGTLLQGDVARVALQFQHFRIMAFFHLGLLAKKFASDPAARKEIAGIMGMSTLLAGTLGTPIAPLVSMVMNMLHGDDDEPYDFEMEFVKWLDENFGEWEKTADAVAHGLPSYLGLNLSKRIGLADVTGTGREDPEYLHGDSLAAYHAAKLLGPSYSVISGWFKGYDDIVNKGDVMRGLESIVPKPLRDGLKAVRMQQDGIVDRGGTRLKYDHELSIDEIFLSGIGFYPSDIAKAQTANRKLNKMSTKISERRGRLIRDIVKSLEGDGSTNEAVQAITTFNNKMPLFAISGSDIRSSYKTKVKKGAKIPTGRDQRLKYHFGLE